jgi:pimeloyl-ACP methyl ester carboxylesterase
MRPWLRAAAVALGLGLGAVGLAEPVAAAPESDLRCDQEPANRFSWTEWGFCDLEAHGPAAARGIVIWNHGISGTAEQYKAPPALALRILHARGWDILKINRNNLGETGSSLSRATARTTDEIRAQRARGYRRVALAGQSFGGYITLETAAEHLDVFAAVALAPGVTSRGGIERIDPSVTERLLQEIKAARIAVVFPPGDALFNNFVRGPGALKVLSQRAEPFLLVDETSRAIAGHGGATGGRFALRYGVCLAELLAADAPRGRLPCPEGREPAAARELLLRGRWAEARPIADGSALPEALQPFNGLWYGLLGETVVVVGLVEGDGATPHVLYRAVSARASGGRYAARVEGGRLRATLGTDRAPTMTLTPAAGEAMELEWVSADGRRSLRGTLRPLAPAD